MIHCMDSLTNFKIIAPLALNKNSSLDKINLIQEIMLSDLNTGEGYHF